MNTGSRDDAGTRLHAEQQFREGATQVLVATEAAGEGINLQCCNILFNYDIPWNPDRDLPGMANLRTDPETEAIAMRVAIEHEEKLGRVVQDVHEKNLGYDITSIDTKSGELRLIEVKGIGAHTGTVFLTPNEKRVAEDRPDCYWLYVVSNCKSEEPWLNEPIPKLKMGGDLSVGLNVSIEVEAGTVQEFQMELLQILQDLNIADTVKVELK